MVSQGRRAKDGKVTKETIIFLKNETDSEKIQQIRFQKEEKFFVFVDKVRKFLVSNSCELVRYDKIGSLLPIKSLCEK